MVAYFGVVAAFLASTGNNNENKDKHSIKQRWNRRRRIKQRTCKKKMEIYRKIMNTKKTNTQTQGWTCRPPDGRTNEH